MGSGHGSGSTGLSVRRASAADHDRILDICLRTADAGRDGTRLYGDGRYPGLVWALPYALADPGLAFLLVDRTAAGEAVLGYVVGTADTAGFEAWAEREWWPRWRRELRGRSAATPDDAAILSLIAEPETADPGLPLLSYPAHLHINILAEAQGAGWGRRMIGRELDALRERGVPGVHLGVNLHNTRAFAFYGRLGFTPLLSTRTAWVMVRAV